MRPSNPFLLLVCTTAEVAACATSRPSAYHGLEQSRWRSYYDSANKQPYTAGRLRHGSAVGTYRYYSPTGALDRSEK